MLAIPGEILRFSLQVSQSCRPSSLTSIYRDSRERESDVAKTIQTLAKESEILHSHVGISESSPMPAPKKQTFITHEKAS